MRFQVPQFIEVEDKIMGPLTLKQFIYIAGGIGLSFVVYVLLKNIFLAMIPIALIMGLSLALAFFKLYRRIPFINVMESALRYWFGSKLYIWKKNEAPHLDQAQNELAVARRAKGYSSMLVPKISESKLKDIGWNLDIKGTKDTTK